MALERREWLPQVVDEPTNRRYFRVLPFPLAGPICTRFSKQPANGRKGSANLLVRAGAGNATHQWADPTAAQPKMTKWLRGSKDLE